MSSGHRIAVPRANPTRMSPRALVCLVDQSHDPRAVVAADRWRCAPPPVIERITHCGEIRRGDGGTREGLVALGGGELHDPVLHCEDGVAAGDLPLTVSAVTRPARAGWCRPRCGRHSTTAAP